MQSVFDDLVQKDFLCTSQTLALIHKHKRLRFRMKKRAIDGSQAYGFFSVDVAV